MSLRRSKCLTVFCFVLALGFAARGSAAPAVVLFTADNEGHVQPCQTCPGPMAQGGMARRATVLAKLRADAEPPGGVLLLDAGNALCGPESLPSRGQVVVAAYNALRYDVVNIAWNDFRFGKAATLAALKDAKFDAVSANLADADGGKLLFHPYVVKSWAGGKVAVIGLTESPAALDVLPHLRRQLAGVAILPPVDALAQGLPKARAEAGQVVLLYYGSVASLRPIRDRFGADLSIILMGGARPEDLDAVADPKLAAAEQHGRSICRVETGKAAPASSQVRIEAGVVPDEAMAALIGRYPAPPPLLQLPAVANLPDTAPAREQVAGDQTHPGAPMASAPGSDQTAAPIISPPVVVPPATAAATSPPPIGSASPKRVTAHQDIAPKGLPGVGLTAEQVNAAIDHGAEFLWNYIKKKDLETGKQQLGDDPPHVLACLALVHAGAHRKFPDFDQALRGYLDRYPPNSYQTVYQYGLASMLIEAYGDPAYFSKLRKASRYLVESQGKMGSWTYLTDVPANLTDENDHAALRVISGVSGAPDPNDKGMSRLTDWSLGQEGDNSCTQFALLGLHSASRCHIKISPELWKRNLDACRRRQCPDGGWAYHEGDTESYGSMTCAGICARAIDRFELGKPQPGNDEGIERGLAWMDGHFSVNQNPASSGYLYYYLYSVERVGRVLDTEFIGPHEWYPLGARFLVDKQEKNGSWLEGSDPDPRCPTSFALLFLTRATPTLNVEIKHGGPGTLKPDIETPPPAKLYFILDASGSMLDIMDGRLKFDLARGAVQGLIDRLPDSTEVALRVYGHRKRSIEEGSDEDTALEIPMGPLDRQKLAAKLKSLRPRGKTPLALSLTQAISDLSWASPDKPVTLVLLTDGGEDTMPRRDPVKVCDQLAKMKGVTFHIIGFDINQEDWGRQLRAMAEHSGAHYWPAAHSNVLQQQVSAAVFGTPDGYVLLDSAGREVARGPFGTPVQLPEGRYSFKTALAGLEFTTPVTITTDSTTGVMFDASHIPNHPATLPASPAATGTPPVAPASVGPPIPHRFCTHCGHLLPPNAKFCPSCGQPVK